MGALRSGINWISALPSPEHEVLPSCQGLRDQAWSPEPECSLPADPAGSPLPFIPKSGGSGDNPTFLVPFQSRQRASAEPTLRAQSQTQKEKFPRDRQKARPPCKAPRVEEGDCQLPLRNAWQSKWQAVLGPPGAQPRGAGEFPSAAVLVSELSVESCL